MTRPPIRVGDVYITDPSASPEEQMRSIDQSLAAHEQNLADAMVRMMDVCEDPVSREDLAYFLATYAIHKDLKADVMDKLRLWLEERDEYMRVQENNG